MALRQQLADPWGLVVAGLAIVAVAVAVVYGLRSRGSRPGRAPRSTRTAPPAPTARSARSARTAPTDRTSPPAPGPAAEVPGPAKGSPAEAWLRRADRAVRALRQQAPAAADRTLDELRGAATRLADVEDAAARIDVPRLQGERTLLVRALFDTPEGPERKRHTRAAQAVADQLAAHGRLREAADALAARLEATVTGLEGLAARLDTTVAGPEGLAGRGTDPVAPAVRDLTGELDGLRSGLAETETVSRQALGG